MAYQIIIRKRFQNKVIKLLNYLETQWGQKVATAFAIKLNEHLQLLAQNPLIGMSSVKVPGIRSCNVSKQNRFYYRIDKSKVIIINMYDTRMIREKTIPVK